MWMSIVKGAAQAFDPLPTKRLGTFCLDDHAAFSADIAKLVIDRLAAEPKVFARFAECFDKTPSVQSKNINGKAYNTFCEAD
jgi:hypothetical protein